MSANPYDEVPYQSFAYAASHPARLATIAALFGLKSARTDGCRVLEIGCAAGGNLLPMAAASPASHFIGIDYSSVQIAEAEKSKAALGLSNIEFRCEDIRAVDVRALGQFDYVIAHGIYSWLPPDAQAAMLGLYRDGLADDGVGYISYNTLPGWRMRGIVRDMMLFHGELFGDDAKRVEQAKALLDFMAGAIPEGNPYGAYLRSEMALLKGVNDSYLRHDHLEEHNEPLYFRDFMARANAAGLHYLGESEFGLMVGNGIAPEAYQRIKAEITDIVRLEQYMDFLRNRSFRQTLLVKNGGTIRRDVSGERLAGLHVAAYLRPAEGAANIGKQVPVRFSALGGQTLTVANPVTKAALSCLLDVFPGTLPMAELATLARDRLPASHRSTISESQDRVTLLNDMLVAATASGLIYLADTSSLAAAPEGRPLGWAYARWQTGNSNVVTSLRHETVALEASARLLLAELDGTRDRAALRTILFEAIRDGRLSVQREGATYVPQGADDPVIVAVLDSALAGLARNALLQSS